MSPDYPSTRYRAIHPLREQAGVKRIPSITRQRGAATILAVILAAIAVIAAGISMMSHLGGAKYQARAVHGATQSQARTWMAVEAMQAYLQTLDNAQLAGLTGDIPISVAGASATATIVDKQQSGANWRITANIKGNGTISTSVVQIVYEVIPSSSGGGGGGGGSFRTPSMILKGNTTMTGNVTFYGSSPAILVDGTLTLNAMSLTGVDTLCSTGDLSFNSNISVSNVCTNGNLTISAGAMVTNQATVKGDVIFNTSKYIQYLWTNGKVSVPGSVGGGHITTLQATGDVLLNAGGVYVSDLSTEGWVFWNSPTSSPDPNPKIRANGTVTYSGRCLIPSPYTTVPSSLNISSQSTVTLTSGACANNVTVIGDLSVGPNFAGVNRVYTGGTLSVGQNAVVGGGSCRVSVSGSSRYSNNIHNPCTGTTPTVAPVQVPKITPLSVTPPTVDANALQSSANYVFTYDGTHIRVAVKNVAKSANVIADSPPGAPYYLAKFGNTFDHICQTLDNAGKCMATATVTPTRICAANGASSCFSPPTSGTWTISANGLGSMAAPSMAPGIFWFQGNLTLSGTAAYDSTFIATGNIVVQNGGEKIYAPNYAGASICTTSYPYPTQFCDAGGLYTPSTLGNVALLAGSGSAGSYVGGNISIANGADINGNIVAGNQLTVSTPNVIVRGIVITAGSNTSQINSVSGSLVIDLRNLPSTYDPYSFSSPPPPPPSLGAARVFWTRYNY